MELRGHTGGWALLLLAASIPGVHLHRKASDTELPPQDQVYRPVLQPSEAAPPTGTYTLKNLDGKPCIKATMGVEYIVIEKKMSWYFNVDPSRTQTGGHCGKQAAVLSLSLPDNSASLQFTFREEKDLFYVTELTAHVSLPVCDGCANKTYSGVLAHDRLFAAANGLSFMCKSESLLLTSSELHIKLVPLQLQAFMPRGQYGEEVECWADFTRRVVPVILGATLVCLVLIPVLSFLFIRDRRRRGYDSL